MPLVILMYSLFASIFTLAKLALEHSSPFFLVGSRMLVAGALLLTYQAIRYPGSPTARTKQQGYWGKIFLLGLFAIYCTNAFEFWGLQFLHSFKACFIYSLSPFFSALLSYFLHGERLSRLKLTGLLIGFLGFLPILGTGSEGQAAYSELFFVSWPELAVIVAAAATVYGWILLGDLIRNYQESPVIANGWSMLIGGCLATAHSFFTEDWSPIPVTDFPPFLLYGCLMIIISNCICYNLYGSLLRKYTATFLSFAGFVTPFFTALYGVFFLGETITWTFLTSASVVFVGLLLFYIEELRLGITPAESSSARVETKAA